MSNDDISIIIPVYNEQHGIRLVVEEVLAAGLGDRLREILIIDDGSTDDSAQQVEGLPKVRVIRHVTNQGLSEAIATGYAEATGEFVVKMDGDGQHPGAELAVLPELLQEHDVVWWMRRSRTGTSWARWQARLHLSTFAAIFTGHWLPDILSGFYCCRRALVMPLLADHPGAMTFDAWLLLLVHELPCRVRLVDYVSRARDDGSGSRMPPWKEGLRLLRVIVAHGWRYHRKRLVVGGLVTVGVLAAIGWWATV